MDFDEIRQALRPRARPRRPFPKDRWFDHPSVKAFPKRFRRAYQRIERAGLHALVAKGASERSNELAVKVASCIPNHPCGETALCWWCKVRLSLQEAETVTDLFADVEYDDISAVTVILGAIPAGELRAVRQSIRSFKRDWRALCQSWPNSRWWGRVELDLLTGHPKQACGTYVRRTLKALGYSSTDEESHVSVHAHLVLAHPSQARTSVRARLSMLYRAPRQIEVKSLRDTQVKEEALARYACYMLKARPPGFALAGRGSRTCRPRYPAAIRDYIRLQRRFTSDELLIEGKAHASQKRLYLIKPRPPHDRHR